MFWIWLVDAFIQQNEDLEMEELVNHFLVSEYAQKDIFFKYYTKELLFSVATRGNWVAPDLRGLLLL
ncbi:MAG: hypothetical protein AB8G86_09525 [Saprospiraceae bacterium]